MRRAARTDDNHEAIVQALRQIGASVQSLATIGKGCPDLLVFSTFCGYLLLEIKDGSKPPSARKLTEDEKRWHNAWKGPVYIVTSVEEALRIALKG